MIDPTQPDYTNTPVSPRRASFGYAPLDLTLAPAVSIVTPFYNTGRVFHETGRSVLQQSFQQWEWLIVNDGSTETESLSLLAQYRQGDPRIRVIDHSTNRGLSAARNTGFHSARAPYVVQLDSDDLLEPTAVEKWIWFLESHPEFAFVKGYTVGFGAQEYLWQKGFHNGREFLRENLVAATSAIRKSVHGAIGGYDEALRQGLEDWDFWLRCARQGHWGSTIPEYLDWYRRRQSHADRWPNLHGAGRQRPFLTRLRQRYPQLWKEGFPHLQPHGHMPNARVPETVPWTNCLRKDKSRLLMLVPWLTSGEADKFNLEVLEQLTRRGWEISVATTAKGNHSWLPYFAQYTPDIFALHHFLRLVDYPRFLRYLIQSRQVDVVMIANSECGYLLLPYLRVCFPEVTFLDFCHTEEEHCKSGGYPHLAVESRELLDLNLVASHHLKDWMVQRGAEPQRIRVCLINLEQLGERMISLLYEAKELAQTRPRELPVVALGRVCASRAIEYARLAEVADEFWREREKRRTEAPHVFLQMLSPGREGWRVKAYFALRRFFLPYYRMAPEKGTKWLLPLKERLKHLLLRQT